MNTSPDLEQTINEGLDRAYNLGIDNTMEVVIFYWHSSPNNNSLLQRSFSSVLYHLNQLKKPISETIKPE